MAKLIIEMELPALCEDKHIGAALHMLGDGYEEAGIIGTFIVSWKRVFITKHGIRGEVKVA